MHKPKLVTTPCVVQDKGVSTLLKEYMRTLNLSMGKRKRTPADSGSKHARSGPGDPIWAPGCGPRQSPTQSPRGSGGCPGHPRVSPVRALPGRKRRKTVRLAEAADLGEVPEGLDNDCDDDDDGDEADLFGELTPTFSRCMQVCGHGMHLGLCQPLWG